MTGTEDIPIGINAIVFAELFYEDDEILSLIYSGKSEIFKVKNSNNKVSLILKKVSLDIEPDDEINAETPTIITQPESSIITATDDVINNKQTLSCTARVSDGGTLSFVWYVKNDIDEYCRSTNSTEITNNDDGSITSILIDFEAHRDQIFYVYCEITNTNNSVNGEKTATIESNIITFACLQGTLTSISASYEENGYQLFSDELDYSKVKVIETYTSSYNSTETTITVPADSSRYIISKTDDSISVIGYVPYTVTYNNTSTNLTSKFRVPVKYELPQEGLKITGTENTNGAGWGTEENPEPVAQFTGIATLSVGYAGDGGSVVPSLIYETENSDSSTNYDVMTSGVDILWENGTVTETSSSVIVDNSTSVVKTYTAKLTPKTDQTWCIGESVSASYYVEVCPWKIELTDSSATSGQTVDVANLTGETEYTLSAKNEANTDGIETITWESSDIGNFTIRDSTLTTPSASTESDKTATISAKVEDYDIASVKVTVPKSESSSTSSITPDITVTSWVDLKSTIESLTSTSTYSLDSPYVIAISDNISTDISEGNTASTITVDSHVKLVSNNTNGITITKTSEYSGTNLFTVSEEASLTLGDENASGNLIIDGGGAAVSPIESTKSLINVSGTLVLNKNSVLQNSYIKNSTHGGAVYSKGGSIIIKGGTVKNNAINYDSNYGGGIYLKDGTFNMSSGVFENNSANKVGGGLYITNSTVNITGGVFSNNKLTGSESPQEGYYGSAFYLESISSESTISNLNFNDNSNAGYGTFYIINSGTSENVVSISNCTFSSNTAYQRGGAIYTGNSYIKIEESTFSSNTVTSETGNGGAVYLYNSTLNISSCTFSSNTANSSTNTIYAADEGSSLTIDGLSVSEYPWNPSTSGGNSQLHRCNWNFNFRFSINKYFTCYSNFTRNNNRLF